jgi:hypothetical protein
MRILLALSLLLVATVPVSAQDAEPDAQTWVYQTAIATAETLHEFGPIFTVIDMRGDLIREAAMDFMAEVANSGMPNGKHDPAIRREIVKALTKAQLPRYFSLLQRISQEKKPSDAREAARYWIARTRIATKAANVPQYQPGSVDLAAFREKLIADALAFQPTDAFAKKLLTLGARRSFDDLFALVGKPQAVESGGRFSLRGSDRAPSMNLYYRGIGRVFFGYKHKSGWYSNHITLDPLAYEHFMPYRVRAAEFGLPDAATLFRMQLLSKDPVAFQVAASNLEDPDMETSRELLDLAAERLLRESPTTTARAHMLGLVYSCNALRLKGGPAYAAVLLKVKETAVDKSLRKYAGITTLSKQYTNYTPFQFGKIDLDAVRAALPPAYPERKEQRNR